MSTVESIQSVVALSCNLQQHLSDQKQLLNWGSSSLWLPLVGGLCCGHRLSHYGEIKWLLISNDSQIFNPQWDSPKNGYIYHPTYTTQTLHPRDFWKAQTNKGKSKKCRLLATAGCCTHPLHTHAHTHKRVHRCMCVCRRVCGNPPDKKCAVFYFHAGLLSCLPQWGINLLRLFQDSGETIPLMVESCICFISRYGEWNSPVQ